MQDICFNEHQLELDPSAVSTACLSSMQEPIGQGPHAHLHLRAHTCASISKHTPLIHCPLIPPNDSFNEVVCSVGAFVFESGLFFVYDVAKFGAQE